MGLDVVVGIFQQMDDEGKAFFREQFANVNQVLTKNGLPLHHEPTTIPYEDEFEVRMYGYSGLHYLRRIALHLWKYNAIPEPGTRETYNDCDAIDLEYVELSIASQPVFPFEHLLLHSDAEGFYLPLQFPRVLYVEEENFVAGKMLGSSYALKTECETLAQHLELPLNVTDDEESAELIEELAFTEIDITPDTPKWQRYKMESFHCYWLYHACQQSIKSGAAVVFT